MKVQYKNNGVDLTNYVFHVLVQNFLFASGKTTDQTWHKLYIINWLVITEV